MNKDLSTLICYLLDKRIIIVIVYIDNFLLTSNYFIILYILKEALGQKYSIKNLEEIQTIIR